jgi:hypothetical protein
MMKKLVSAALVCLLLSAFGSTVLGQTKAAEADAKLAERIKKLVHKTGVGIDDQISLTLKDGTTLVGYISEIGADNFVMSDKTTGAPSNVSYDQVATARIWSLTKNGLRKERPKPGSTFKLVGIGVAVGLGGLITACIVSKRCQN